MTGCLTVVIFLQYERVTSTLKPRGVLTSKRSCPAEERVVLTIEHSLQEIAMCGSFDGAGTSSERRGHRERRPYSMKSRMSSATRWGCSHWVL